MIPKLKIRFFKELLGILQQKDVGIVGGMLLYPNRKIQHAGCLLFDRMLAEHTGYKISYEKSSSLYSGYLHCTHEVSNVVELVL